MTELVFDIHFTPKKHHFEACRNYVAWEESRPVEPMTTVLMGDVFDSPENQGPVNALVARLVNARRRHGRVICIRGNHDYTKTEGSAIDLLKELGVEVIDHPRVMDIDGVSCLILPYIWSKTLIEGKLFTSMNEVYSAPAALEVFTGPLRSDSGWNFTHVLTHVGDETAGEYAMNCDLSWCNTLKVLGGHIHKQVSKHYPGSTRITRRDEAGKENVFIRMTKSALEAYPIPSFLDYATVMYPDPPKMDAGHTIWITDVERAPDPDRARKEYLEKYPGVRLGKVERPVELHAPLDITASGPSDASTSYLLNEFLKTTKVRPQVADLMVKTLHR